MFQRLFDWNNLQKAVTFFFDIDRSAFKAYPRTKSSYVNNFLSFFSNVKVDLLILTDLNEKKFIESRLTDYQKNNQFLSKITFHTLDFSLLPLYQEIARVERVLLSPEMFFYSLRDKIAGNPNIKSFSKIVSLVRSLYFYKGNNIFKKFSIDQNFSPEYYSSKYLLTVLSKVEVLRIARELGFFQDQSRFTFIDFGQCGGDKILINHFSGKTLKDTSIYKEKVLLINRIETPKLVSPWYYAKLIDDALTPSNFFMIPALKFDEFYNWWHHQIQDLLSQNLIIDDQVLLSIFQANYPNEVENLVLTGKPVCNLHQWIPLDDYLV